MRAVYAQMTPDELTMRLQQASLVAEFGLFALGSASLPRLQSEACRIAAEGLATAFSKVLRYREVEDDFLVEAGVGWHAGVVGNATLGGGLDSPAGFALHTGEPTLANHLGKEDRFRIPALLAEHGVQSALNVVIGNSADRPYGVLEVDSTRRNEFADADTAFLQSLANTLAAAQHRAEAEGVKDGLIRDNDLLVREVHHRLKNSLQLVRTMLSLQARGASDEVRAELESASGRIMSIAAVHHRLYEGRSVNMEDAALYLEGLLGDIRAMMAASDRRITLDCAPMMLAATTLTPLGLIVSELVTNALKHGEGDVSVRVEATQGGLRLAVEDRGDGLPDGFDRSTGLGMRLIKALAKGRDAIQVDRGVAHGRVVVDMTF